ncbi:G-box-binding factor 3-like isoform X2 [Canna indica]|uniref:G-box-binding factor 3-like isoform X2 n=1 Tax=Canna indica TaxID=4628 RepID=A0AAQ3Q6R5_9LILI|nr:G-box-binding factor 3-like isoform X2 [Canna indica]
MVLPDSDPRILEINLISAQGLRLPSRLRRLHAYAVIWVDPAVKLRTFVDRVGGENPTWNEKFLFLVPGRFLADDSCSAVNIEIYAGGGWYRPNSLIGAVRLLVSNLHLLSRGRSNRPVFEAVGVRRPSGRFQGVLNVGATVLRSVSQVAAEALAARSAIGFRKLMETPKNRPRAAEASPGESKKASPAINAEEESASSAVAGGVAVPAGRTIDIGLGNSEVMTSSKSEKTSSAVQEQPAVHPYPDWSAMQAYYGPGIMPHPYFNPSSAPGHAPHPYMWPPQPLIPPFGSPYAALYPHGVYPHPSFPFGTHGHYPGIAQPTAATTPVLMATPLSIGMPDKSPRSKDKGLMSKLKGFDGLAVSVGNKNAKNEPEAYGNELSHSGYNSADGSSNGSDGSNSAGVSKNQRKRGSEDISSSDLDTNVGPAYSGERGLSPIVSSTVAVVPTIVAGNPSGNLTPSYQGQAVSVKTIGTPVPAPTLVVPGSNTKTVPSELWTQDERVLKRERRKQSNRESARRSRLRKQAENEELAKKVEALNVENRSLKSEINQLTKSSHTLREENSALLAKLNAQVTPSKELSPNEMEVENAPSVAAENFLSKIDKPNLIDPTIKLEDVNSDKSKGKLGQLLDTSPRTDAVAAS